jgi:hypothetical protein
MMFSIILKKKINDNFKRQVFSKVGGKRLLVYPVLAVETNVVTGIIDEEEEPSSEEKLNSAFDEVDEAVFEKHKKREPVEQVVTWFLIAHPNTGEFTWVDSTEVRYHGESTKENKRKNNSKSS